MNNQYYLIILFYEQLDKVVFTIIKLNYVLCIFVI